MAPRSRVNLRAVEPTPYAPPPPPNEPPPCEQAAATREHAAAIDRMTERFGPAADTVAGFGDRLDKLCLWLSGRKPWMTAIAILVLARVLNMNLKDVGELVKSIAPLVGALS